MRWKIVVGYIVFSLVGSGKMHGELPKDAHTLHGFEDVHPARDLKSSLLFCPKNFENTVRIAAGEAVTTKFRNVTKGELHSIDASDQTLKRIDRGFMFELDGRSFVWCGDSIFLNDSISKPKRRYLKDTSGVLRVLHALLDHRILRSKERALEVMEYQLRRFEIILSEQGKINYEKMTEAERKISK